MVIVTGATSGIGEAIVEAFAATGASVVLVGRDRERGQRALQAAKELNCQAELMLGDVADSAFANQVIDSTVERFGEVSVLVNSAGIIRRGSAVDTTDDDWRQTFAANVNGVFYFSRAAVKGMRKTGGGSIVNIASNVGVGWLSRAGCLLCIEGRGRFVDTRHGARSRQRANQHQCRLPWRR